jgi:hypothetical protein
MNNQFDKKLEAHACYMPASIRYAAVEVTDTLDLAWAAAQAVFEDLAKPEHAIKILELFLTHKAQIGEIEDRRKLIEDALNSEDGKTEL